MVADPLEGSLAWWQTVSGKCDRLEVSPQHTYVTPKIALQRLGQDVHRDLRLLYSFHIFINIYYTRIAGVLHFNAIHI